MQAILVGEKIAEHDNLAKKMKPYLKYKLRRIREWAQWKIEYSNDLINDNKHMEVIKER
ncbi:hypothetical protein J2Z42_001911 [Clostridium algifaecis]|uniref:Uncharacterized protein n=1 Tax=Clostridium algifaecis TaxID=1472040 RepID=A0ABS4KT55_9CLOT|nr:hypothetical protein [Clostridium algifaecis]MBP2033224.1 hypothetical protein [Clostridium algifaecis]